MGLVLKRIWANNIDLQDSRRVIALEANVLHKIGSTVKQFL